MGQHQHHRRQQSVINRFRTAAIDQHIADRHC
jgi:hypothetical protein